jgi:hypothetical protein
MNKYLIFFFGLFLAYPTHANVGKADTQQQLDDFEEQVNQVVFIDHDLNRVEISSMFGNRKIVKVTTERQGSKKSPTGTLRAWAVLKNRTDHDLQVEGRIIFLDNTLLPLDDTTAWKRMYIPANGIGTYRDSSMSFDASHYIIELREGR